MPRPLRKPDEHERETLNRITAINTQITDNIEKNKNLSSERRQIVTGLLEQGWSMYGIAVETGMSPNTVKRIIDGGNK